jgi:hypothetical protein
MALPRNLYARLRRLEESFGPVGCPACRDRRGRSFPCTCQELSDGAQIHKCDLPPPCPECGEIPEQIVEIIEMVETREDVERVKARQAAEAASVQRSWR